MSHKRNLLILANSRKKSGRCIAGIDITAQGWVRPVSDRSSHEISESEYRYNDGSYTSVLDLVDIDFIAMCPCGHQCENELINKKSHWIKTGTYDRKELDQWLNSPIDLWGTGHSSGSGINNRTETPHSKGCSLYLISIDIIKLIVGPKSFHSEKRAVRGRFTYKSVEYQFDVTDPCIETEYLAKTNGSYILTHKFICVSLSDSFEGWHYKLIASIV